MPIRANLLLTAAILLALTACTTRPAAEAVSKFSVALDSAASSVQRGLGEIQRLETAANDAAEAENFVRATDPSIQFGRIANITDEVIAPRLAFFEALAQYAASLTAAVSDEQVASVRAQFAATGQAFSALGESVAAASGSTFPTDLAGRVTEAVADIAAFMVEEKLNREIPVIVAAVHEDLETGVEAFKADLGDPDTGGFRAIMDDSIEILIIEKKKRLLLLKEEGATPAAVLYDEVLREQSAVRELRRSTELLDAIPPALDKMLAAHLALKTPAEQTTLGKIQIFLERAKELQAIANRLRSLDT